MHRRIANTRGQYIHLLRLPSRRRTHPAIPTIVSHINILQSHSGLGVWTHVCAWRRDRVHGDSGPGALFLVGIVRVFAWRMRRIARSPPLKERLSKV
jgi:hypothetical protein